MIKAQTLKGFRDFLPKDAKKREYVINTLKKVFESYGFEPLETPALEYEEVLTGKYGDEGDKLMYKFKDRGGRNVALRYDQTVPLARVVAQYQNDIPLPFKRYQIQNVWRAENTQKGRYREFLQCDIDTIGTSSSLADAEVIACSLSAIEALGFGDYQMLINDRKVFEGFSQESIRILDKTDKIGELEVLKLLNEKDKEMYNALKSSKPTVNINNLYSSIQSLNKKFKEKLSYYPWGLARGLNYYTGLIFELRVKGSGGLSVGGGGRYDNLIGIFAGRDIPAVGFSFGFDRVIEAMEEQNLFPDNLQTVKVLVTNTGERSLDIANKLRGKGISTQLYLEEKDLEKQMKYADKKGIPYVLKVSDKLLLRNMETGEEKEVNPEKLPDELI